MPVAARLGLGQHEARLVGIGGDQMHARNLLAVDATQRLAVKGQRLLRRQSLGGAPLPQHPLEGGMVQAAKGAMERRHTRPPFHPQPQRQADLRLARAPHWLMAHRLRPPHKSAQTAKSSIPSRAWTLPAAPHSGQRLQRCPQRAFWRRGAPVRRTHAASPR
jgi:hypothetical protein